HLYAVSFLSQDSIIITGQGGTILSSFQSVLGINKSNNQVPGSYKLLQNYPNPFNPNTVIEFSLADRSYMNLKVYDVTGKEIETLVNQILNAGNYKVSFNGQNLTSGIYFYRLQTNEFAETKKMILIK
ncbi:MAG TPA: T9SS type A sorting domain-containing protein, partial [Ignavibacteria bacterium]|nr:T9SS type A sorting domain-containing protein [Ignavibacteria bacterium]